MIALVQTLGLHPSVAFVVFAVDVMLFGADLTGVGWLLSCAVAAVLTVPCYLMQRNAYGDEWQVALGKAVILGLLTAIPTPLPGFLTAAAGVVGIGGKLLGCGRRRGTLPTNSMPELPADPTVMRLCCPSCAYAGRLPARHAGRAVICPKCKSQFKARMAALDGPAPSVLQPRRAWAASFALAGCLIAAILLGALAEAFREKPAEATRALDVATQPVAVVKQPEPVMQVGPSDGSARFRTAPEVNLPVTEGSLPLFPRQQAQPFSLIEESPFGGVPAPAPPLESEALDEQRAARAVAKILAAAGVEVLGREAEKAIPEEWRELFGPVVREARRVGRDELIEGALHDVFPELPARPIRVIRLVVSQILDGRLSLRNTAWPFAQDELIEILKRYDADLAHMTKVQLLLHRIAMAK